ncbi:GMC oxidoreductase [Rhodotorula toruloides]|nr:GMC oxidoreductase [Rhodotorula toruloides]
MGHDPRQPDHTSLPHLASFRAADWLCSVARLLSAAPPPSPPPHRIMPVLAQSASSSTSDSRPKPSTSTARRLPSASPAGPADPPPPAADAANPAPSYLASFGNYIAPFLRRRTSSSSYMPSPPPAADQPAAGPSTASTSANAAASTSHAGASTSTAANGAPAPARAASGLRAVGTPMSDHDVIDLTTSSPPRRHRHLVPAVRASGLAFPGVPGPSNAGASTSAAGAAAGPSNALRPLRCARRSVVYVSDGDDTDDTDYRPRNQPQRTAADTDDDSDIEIVSERAAHPLPRIHSPPPYIVPPNATATTSVAGRGRNPQLRRSTRVAQPANHADADDADASAARRLAAEYAAEGGVAGDYLAAQARAMDQARAGPAAGLAGRGFGGIFSPGLGGPGGAARHDPFAGVMNREGLLALLGGGLGGFWNGGHFIGAAGLYGQPAPQINGGWGGAAKVRAASKKYGVRMSHPRPVEKGFSRDIIEPRDPDTAEPPAKRVKGKGKAKAPPEEMQPVCASCLDPLLLGGEGDKKVFALRCGHVVCARCLGEAKARCQEIREREKGGWVMDVDEDGGGGKGKGKAREPLLLSDDDDDDLYGDAHDADFYFSDEMPPARSSKSSAKRSSKRDKGKGKATAAASSSKLKGKGKSRADETGIEELWTTCPVSTCDGNGTDLLATEGWSRPYELFA